MATSPSYRLREYGSSGPRALLLHGGPGAPGYMAGLAQELSDSCRAIEVLQRGSSRRPLTVETHIADLQAVVESQGSEAPLAIIGHSWGAMLALAHAAEHPNPSHPILLLGCGTFDKASRAKLEASREARMKPSTRKQLVELSNEPVLTNENLRAAGNLFLEVDSFEPRVRELEMEECDANAHRQTWRDMLRLQAEGTYPSRFSRIESQVLMLHGDFDPHPGSSIAANLGSFIERFEYRELDRCGHYPWIETHARDAFYSMARDWIGAL